MPKTDCEITGFRKPYNTATFDTEKHICTTTNLSKKYDSTDVEKYIDDSQTSFKSMTSLANEALRRQNENEQTEDTLMFGGDSNIKIKLQRTIFRVKFIVKFLAGAG